MKIAIRNFSPWTMRMWKYEPKPGDKTLRKGTADGLRSAEASKMRVAAWKSRFICNSTAKHRLSLAKWLSTLAALRRERAFTRGIGMDEWRSCGPDVVWNGLGRGAKRVAQRWKNRRKVGYASVSLNPKA